VLPPSRKPLNLYACQLAFDSRQPFHEGQVCGWRRRWLVVFSLEGQPRQKGKTRLPSGKGQAKA